MRCRLLLLSLFLVGLASGGIQGKPIFTPRPQHILRLKTGKSVVVPALTTTFNSRPIDMVLSRNHNFAYVKTDAGLEAIDLKTGADHSISVPGGTSQLGIILLPGPDHTDWLACSNADSSVEIFATKGIHLSLSSTIKIPSKYIAGASFPCGMAVSADGAKLYVCMSRDNCLAEVNLKTKSVRRFKTAPAPFAVTLMGQGNALVSCLSEPAQKGQGSAKSSGTAIPVDKRGIATHGELDLINIGTGRVTHRARLGLLPGTPIVSGSAVYVAVANSDLVETFRASDLKRERPWRISPAGRFGASPNSVCLTGSGNLAVACGGLNEVRVYSRTGRLIISEPTPDYPIAVATRKSGLVVACTKGVGNSTAKPAHGRMTSAEGPVMDSSSSHPARGYSISDSLGTVSIILPHSPPTKGGNLQIPHAATGHHLPSGIKHVIYIIKENRTYDQVFGDMADGDPDLLNFGQKVTPNEHQLATDFGLLARYFCDSIISTDGHAWSTEANSNAYLERSFGGWTRSYPWGDDPLAISSSGAIWDDAIDHGRTFRNYGEYVYGDLPAKTTFLDCFNDWKSGRTIPWTPRIQEKRLWAYSDHKFPGWNLTIPDQFRADEFIRDYSKRVKAGKTPPDLTVLYLDQDHTAGEAAGMPTPQAMNADNDYAIGRIVQAVSHSKYWKSTAIFITEDDPQNGYDHIDGHRSVALVISPFTRRNRPFVNRTYYDQASLLHTIEALLHLPPMTRFDRNAPILFDCFTDHPDFRPYTAIAPKISLTTINGAGHQTLRFAEPDESDDLALNRQIWESVYPHRPYPIQYCPPPDDDSDRDGD